MPTFGNTNIEPTEGSWELGLYQGCKFTKPETGKITHVLAYVAARAGTEGPSRGGLHDTNGNKIAESINEEQLTSTFAWHDYRFNTDELPAGDYWLVVGVASTVYIRIRYSSVAGAIYAGGSFSTYPTLPSTISALPYTLRMSIYGVYETGAPSALSVAVNPSSASLQVGQQRMFTAVVTGGTPPYTYQWLDSISSAPLGTGSTYVFNATAEGSYSIYLVVTDSLSVQSSSPVVPITVTTTPPPSDETMFDNCHVGGELMSARPLHVEGRYIKDEYGNIIKLRGVNKVEFADDPDGIWMGSTTWRDENVAAELDAMKSWGVNIVRCHLSVDLWKYDIGPGSGNPASPYCAISAREAIKRFLTMAAERGIYVILDSYSVRSYWTGGQQDPLPFPPHQTSENASEVIASVDDFVDFWRSVAVELKNYPNVMFSLWNEASEKSGSGLTAEEGLAVWLDAFQRSVNAIRETGFNGIILFEWRTGVYCNIYTDGPKWGYTLRDWLGGAITYLKDPTGNLAFDVHFYRSGGGTGLYVTADMQEKWGSRYAWNYDQIKMAMEYMGYRWAVEELNVPLIIGEIGGNLGWETSNPTEHQHEMIGFANTLKILNEWGIHYIAFWWRNIGVYRLLEYGVPWVPPPTESGQILKISETTQVSVTFATTGNGTISTGTGLQLIDIGTTITATPNTGETFVQWLLDGVFHSSSNSLTVTADLDGHTLTAEFSGATPPPTNPLVIFAILAALGLAAAAT